MQARLFKLFSIVFACALFGFFVSLNISPIDSVAVNTSLVKTNSIGFANLNKVSTTNNIDINSDARSQKQKIINIALAGDLSISTDLSASPYGQQLRRGVQLALQDRAKDLRRANIQIKISEFDSEGDRDKVKLIAQQVVDSNVAAVLGHVFSSEALSAAPTYNQAKLLYVSPAASAERLKAMGSNIVRTVFSNQEQAKVLVQALVREGLSKVVTISVKDCAYCEDLRLNFESEIHRQNSINKYRGKSLAVSPKNIKILNSVSVLSDDDSANSANSANSGDDAAIEALAKSKEIKQAEVIFLPNYEAINGKIIASLSKYKIQPKTYLGGDGWGLASEVFDQKINTRNDKNNFNAIVMAYWSPDLSGAKAASFAEKYKLAFQDQASDTAVLAYDAMQRLIEISLRAAKDSSSSDTQDIQSSDTLSREQLILASKKIRFSPAALGFVKTDLIADEVSRPYVMLRYQSGDAGLILSGSEIRSMKIKLNEFSKGPVQVSENYDE